jgi:cysteinyl-tRNA synthetase
MGTGINIFNTETRQKEEFCPIKAGRAKVYHCGPTVYWTQHIGNLRGMYVGDMVIRVLRYAGLDVTYARNYTDVGHLTSDEDEGQDKMEKGAKREGLTPAEIAAKYINQFERDADALNIREPSYKPRATEYIPQMIDFIQILLDKGYAYATDLAIYFDVGKVDNYTRLSRQKLDELRESAGKGEVYDPAKRDQLDFVVWFFRAGSHARALQYWESPFESPLVEKGYGFPGWHLECSVMSKALLGDTIDIHLGGIEHIPIHHTNEIAQSEAVNGVKFVNYWMHNEHLLVDNKKMAKSEGTGITIDQIKEKGFSPLALRLFFLQAHYRSKQNFTWEALEAAENGRSHLLNQLRELGEEVGKVNDDFRKEFLKALFDDFNTPQALALVQRVLRSDMADKDKLATVLDFDQVLGLDLVRQMKGLELPYDVSQLVEQRKAARDNKDFTESDRLRDEIQARGYVVKDSKDGMRVYPA